MLTFAVSLVEAILQGRQPVELTATRLTELDLPLDWTERCEPGLLRPFSLTGVDAVPPPEISDRLRWPRLLEPGASLLTSPATRRPPPKCEAFRLQPRGSPLRQTDCWRKADSNRRSPNAAVFKEARLTIALKVFTADRKHCGCHRYISTSALSSSTWSSGMRKNPVRCRARTQGAPGARPKSVCARTGLTRLVAIGFAAVVCLAFLQTAESGDRRFECFFLHQSV